MKVFISQPMGGRSEEEILDARIAAIAILKEKYGNGIEIIDSNIKNSPSSEIRDPALWYLGESIKLMADADLVYFCPGWIRARGCKVENEVAKLYGIECMWAVT